MGQGQPVPVAAPLLYLLLGTEAALLHDTGATAAERSPIRRTVAEVLEGRQRRILVTHAHGHGDHWAGEAPFADLLSDAVAPIGQEAIGAFFGLEDQPRGEALLDLGDRPIDVLFDRTRGLLLSGALPASRVVDRLDRVERLLGLGACMWRKRMI